MEILSWTSTYFWCFALFMCHFIMNVIHSFHVIHYELYCVPLNCFLSVHTYIKVSYNALFCLHAILLTGSGGGLGNSFHRQRMVQWFWAGSPIESDHSLRNSPTHIVDFHTPIIPRRPAIALMDQKILSYPCGMFEALTLPMRGEKILHAVPRN